MKRIFLFLALLASHAFAQPYGGVIVSSNNLPKPAYQTYGNLNLFVDAAGSDTNACTASGASACLTLQGAINKIPARVRHPVDVTMSAGIFAGAVVSGFSFSPVTQLDGGFLRVRGTLQAATVATGTNSGTATAGTAGSNQTFGTLADGAQAWTVDDLKGKLVAITGGTGINQIRAIVSNTATALTIAGTWTAPNGTSTYEIRSWGTRLDTGVISPASPTIAASGTNVLHVYGNTMSTLPSPMVDFSDIEIDATTSSIGVRVGSLQGFSMERSRVFASSGSSLLFFTTSAHSLRGNDNVFQHASTTGSVFSFSFVTSSVGGGSGVSFTRNLFESNISASSLGFIGGLGMTVTGSQFNMLNAAATAASSALTNSGVLGFQQWNANNFTCASSSTVGISFSDTFSNNGQSAWGGSAFNVTGCATAIVATGRFKVYVSGSSVLTGVTTGISASLGANFQVSSGSTVTGGTQDYLLDTVGFSAATLSSTIAGQTNAIGVPGYGTYVQRL